MFHDLIYQCNSELEETDKLLKALDNNICNSEGKKSDIECQLILHFRTHQRLIDELSVINTDESRKIIQQFEEKKQQFQDLIYNENSSSISIPMLSDEDDENDYTATDVQYSKLGDGNEKKTKWKKSKIEMDFFISLMMTMVYCIGFSLLWSFVSSET